ncbi:sulfite exporter TauE/SafE family protein [Mesobacillus foraminis]|uniref:sulfite exporter TauE/SafE family protein n=1 Tax=Mesobacillus foraminis TaxID=279826 RepID=UPI0039A2F816
MSIMITMLFLGLILGFIGAGGSGFIIALLVTIFNVPIHTALGTAVAVMALSVLSGSWSHFREGNVKVKQGLIVGCLGGIGAYFGTQLTKFMDPHLLLFFTAGALTLSGLLLWARTRLHLEAGDEAAQPKSLTYLAVGVGNGFISGVCGIGAAPFIQLSLIKWLHFPLRMAVGTTMLVILPIALSASFGFVQNGYLEGELFLKVAAGTIVGTYLGAKLTRILPRPVLRFGMVLTPVTSAILLFINLF